MSLRSLVKERKAASRLDHPAATYTNTGKLVCNVCSLPIKHDALFAAHLSSKQHRTNVQARAQAQAKRAREAEDVELASPESEEAHSAHDETGPDRKRVRVAATDAANGLPADFFADPSQAPPSPAAAHDSPPPVVPADDDEDDDEWAAFQRDVLNSSRSTSRPAAAVPSFSVTATIHAEPVLYNDDDAGENGATAADAPEDVDFGAPQETEEERRARLDQEEKEELLSRIEEEEREQLEADERVEAMKKRLAAVREAKATLKGGGAASPLAKKTLPRRKRAM